jgi:GntR family transcriptional repressor for pyruvate dehydrogenase complex
MQDMTRTKSRQPVLDPFAHLLRSNPETAFDYLEFRELLAGEAAAFAANRATDEQVARIRAAMAAMEAAHEEKQPAAEFMADSEFHLAIYEAAGNQVMVHIMRRIIDLLRQGVFYDQSSLYLRRGVRDSFLRQHRASSTPSPGATRTPRALRRAPTSTPFARPCARPGGRPTGARSRSGARPAAT